MSIFQKFIGISCVLCTTAVSGVCLANDCKEIDPEGTVAALMEKHEGSKVLKIEETTDAQGCAELTVRILIDGTVKAITIPNTTGA